jgi:hypothetical protein
MKSKMIVVAMLVILSACASEFEIAASEVPDSVLTAFKNKYPGATEAEWEVEKKDGKLYFEAEFKINGKKKEAYFRPDGTFGMEE